MKKMIIVSSFSPEHVGDLGFDIIRSSSLVILNLREVDVDGGGRPGNRVGDDSVANNHGHGILSRLGVEIGSRSSEIEVKLVVLVDAGLRHKVDLGSAGDMGEADKSLVDCYCLLGGGVLDCEG